MVSPHRGSGSPKRETPGGSQRKSGGQGGRSPARGSSTPGVIVDDNYGNQSPSHPSNPPPQLDAADPLVGTVLNDRYLILERLSQGGMGVVYKARHTVLDAPVAIKILLEQRDTVASKRFLQEAKLASKVRHANTVYISDFGQLPDPDGRLYLVMELLRGPTLSREISNGRLEPLRACQLALQMLTGLQAIHDSGIIHRDLKPENIFLIDQRSQGNKKTEGEDSQELVKIVDFGIAQKTAKPRSDPSVAGKPSSDPRVSTDGAPVVSPSPAPAAGPPLGQSMSTSGPGARLTIAGQVMGTPLYMSPEQVEGGDLDARSDQYAFGCILYEMLTGTVPFDGPTPESVMIKHLQLPPLPPEERCPEARIHRRLSALVLRCLSKERAQRYPSLQDLIKDLQAEITRLLVARGQKVLVTKSSADVFKRGNRYRAWALASVGVLVIGGGALAVRLLTQRPPVEQVVQLQPGEALAARRSALTILTDALADTNPAVRLGAVSALSITRDSNLRARLEPLLSDANPEVQAHTATALGLLGDRGAIPALRSLYEKSTVGGVRVAAAAALDQLGEPEGSLALRQALESGDDQSRLKAALLLCERGEPRARALLSTAVKNPKLPEEAAITLLARLAQIGDAEARTQLEQRMKNSGRRDVQLLAAAKLVQAGDDRGRAFLRTVVQNRDQAQLPAARFLAAPDEATGLEVLRRVAADRNASASERLLAFEGLGQAGRVIDVRTLQPLLQPTNPDATLRRGAAAAIVKLTAGEPGTLSEQSLSWARLAISDSDWVVRESAALVLGDAASPQAGDLLATLAKDREAYVRRAAVRALARRGESAGFAVLRSRLSDGDMGVRLETLRGLAQLAGTLLKRGGKELVAELTAAITAGLERGTPEEQLMGRVVLLRLGDSGQKEALRSWLSSSDAEQRRLLIDYAGNDVDLLRGALTDESFELRLLAARRLASLHDSRAIPILREALTQGGVSALQAYASLKQLGEKLDKPVDPRADQPTGAAPLTVEQRLRLVESMVDLPPADAVPGLRRAARDGDPRVRQQAAEVAAALPVDDQGPQGAPVLRLLLEDSDMAVRARTAALLSRLLKPATPATPEPTPEPTAAKPAPTPPVAAPTPVEPVEPVAPKGREETVKQLAQTGLHFVDNKEFGKAEQALEKAQRQCAKERKSSSACSEIAFDVAYNLGRAHEGQKQPAQAMVDYENAIKLALSRKSRPPMLRDAQDAVMRLVPKLGVVVVPKMVQKSCREVSLWMEPGQHEIQVNGQREVVEVRAHESKKVGSCPSSER